MPHVIFFFYDLPTSKLMYVGWIKEWDQILYYFGTTAFFIL